MSLITINEVDCKDCYKCVRYCPVKAIRVVNGHAEVDDERCLADGGCVHICPQHAKQIRSDRDVVAGLLASGRKVFASVAPSAAGVFGENTLRLVAALRKLGFDHIEETARTAEAVARAHADFMAASDKSVIATSCPAVVSLVEKYYPQYLDRLAPVPSPMVAHARLLREEHGAEIAVVFIGPCIAKKGEAYEAGIDAVLTFDEITTWLYELETPLSEIEPSQFDNPPVGVAALFPLRNGLVKTASLPDDSLDEHIITVEGLTEIMKVFDELDSLTGVRLVEALACKGGCLMGPGTSSGPEQWTRRAQLIKNAAETGTGAAPSDMSCTFRACPPNLAMPTEEEIATILRRTGKHSPADEQNCGACGYDSCRAKAIAVFQGMAEAEMCIPYMHSRAESFANVIIKSTPNGIVTVDSQFRVLDANPAFEEMFGHPVSELIGRPIETVVDPNGFKRAFRSGRAYMRPEVTYGNLTVREMIFPAANEDMVIGLYTDITDETARHQKMMNVKAETLGKARTVIENQMRVAQEIAGLLGETTAETKVLLTRLIGLYDEEEGEGKE